MTAAKVIVGLLYKQKDTDTCKRISVELLSRCSDVEIQADVVVNDPNQGQLTSRGAYQGRRQGV